MFIVRHIQPKAKLTVLLCIISISMMLLAGCTGNGKKSSYSTGMEQEPDSVTTELQSASSEPDDAPEPAQETENPIGQLSVFDELESNMICVDGDTVNFYICKYEVTQKLWSEVMGENPSQMQGDDLPVEQVSWYDCQAFISKLNELTGKSYRIPTEAEWEYACRGGKYSKGYVYSGSNDLDKVAWFDKNSDGKTHPVGQKMPNELGLYDMNGNVWEWCQDLHGPDRVCRGGSWIHNERNCDPSHSNETPQSFKINSLGLRLAL